MGEIVAESLSWLCLVFVAGGIALGLWFFRARTRQLLPPQRRRAVPWGGLEVFLAFFLAYVMVLPIVEQVLTDSGFFRLVYGPEFPATASITDDDPSRQLAAGRRFLWASTFAFPFELGVILLLLKGRSGAHLYQVGLTTRRWPADVLAGYVFWLVLALPVLGLNWLVASAYEMLLGGPPRPHPLGIVLDHLAGSAEWSLIVFDVVIAAPIIEELFFRGLVQKWLMTRSWGGNLAMAWAVVMAVAGYANRAALAKQAGDLDPSWTSTLDRLAPVLFVLVMLPGYLFAERLAWRWLPYPNVARTIYGTAMLFAAFHSSVWPSPIPLFFLALGLGYLAYRTQSLIGPIVMHGLFNAVSVIAEPLVRQ